jgi:hypothetical protein
VEGCVEKMFETEIDHGNASLDRKYVKRDTYGIANPLFSRSVKREIKMYEKTLL